MWILIKQRGGSSTVNAGKVHLGSTAWPRAVIRPITVRWNGVSISYVRRQVPDRIRDQGLPQELSEAQVLNLALAQFLPKHFLNFVDVERTDLTDLLVIDDEVGVKIGKIDTPLVIADVKVDRK